MSPKKEESEKKQMRTDLNIRNMTPQDYDGLLALWKQCTGMGLNNLDDTFSGISRFLERNPATCFVCEQYSEITGAILAADDGRRGYIYHTAVRPDCRRKGIGKALAEAALNALHQQGVHKVSLVVFASNENGNAFWEKLGFAPRSDLVYRDRTLDQMIKYST